MSLDTLTPGTWTIDGSHSTIGFTARHLMVTKVRGRFTQVEGAIAIAADPLQSSVTATVQAASISTGDDQRDGHLRTGDFLDVDTYPTLSFVSSAVRRDGGDYVLAGDLTIKGVSRPVEFVLEFEGVAGDPWGGTRAGFTAETEINRKDFGLEYNAVLETGGVLIGEKVKVTLDIQAVKS